MTPAARRRVLLLFGGRSAEHDVSRATAVAVARRARPGEVRHRAGRDHDRRPVAARGRGARAARGPRAVSCPRRSRSWVSRWSRRRTRAGPSSCTT